MKLDNFLLREYVPVMDDDAKTMVVPKDFPELSRFVWNRDPSRPIEREQVFELYERNWRHVDAENLTDSEAALIEELTQEFGRGHRMFCRLDAYRCRDEVSAVKLERPRHVAIRSALQSMDRDFLQRSRCYFSGGTAIVLMNGEYRLSREVEFLCADMDGYREIHNTIREGGAGSIFGQQVENVRDFRSDQYGIRGVVSLGGSPVKFDIVRESRIPLDGVVVEGLGVPMLTIESQFAEKLLDNADRRLDRSVAYCDAIDLGFLVKGVGFIPAVSVEVAERAYGKDILKGVGQALERLSIPGEARHAADTLQMQLSDVMEAAGMLRAAAVAAWPGADFPGLSPADLPEP